LWDIDILCLVILVLYVLLIVKGRGHMKELKLKRESVGETERRDGTELR
jgi:hypothetical protein